MRRLVYSMQSMTTIPSQSIMIIKSKSIGVTISTRPVALGVIRKKLKNVLEIINV